MLLRLFSAAANNKSKGSAVELKNRVKAVMSKIKIVEAPNVDIERQEKMQKLRETLRNDDLLYEKKVQAEEINAYYG